MSGPYESPSLDIPREGDAPGERDGTSVARIPRTSPLARRLAVPIHGQKILARQPPSTTSAVPVM
jgi:hypothetical protein